MDGVDKSFNARLSAASGFRQWHLRYQCLFVWRHQYHCRRQIRSQFQSWASRSRFILKSYRRRVHDSFNRWKLQYYVVKILRRLTPCLLHRLFAIWRIRSLCELHCLRTRMMNWKVTLTIQISLHRADYHCRSRRIRTGMTAFLVLQISRRQQFASIGQIRNRSLLLRSLSQISRVVKMIHVQLSLRNANCVRRYWFAWIHIRRLMSRKADRFRHRHRSARSLKSWISAHLLHQRVSVFVLDAQNRSKTRLIGLWKIQFRRRVRSRRRHMVNWHRLNRQIRFSQDFYNKCLLQSGLHGLRLAYKLVLYVRSRSITSAMIVWQKSFQYQDRLYRASLRHRRILLWKSIKGWADAWDKCMKDRLIARAVDGWRTRRAKHSALLRWRPFAVRRLNIRGKSDTIRNRRTRFWFSRWNSALSQTKEEHLVGKNTFHKHSALTLSYQDENCSLNQDVNPKLAEQRNSPKVLQERHQNLNLKIVQNSEHKPQIRQEICGGTSQDVSESQKRLPLMRHGNSETIPQECNSSLKDSKPISVVAPIAIDSKDADRVLMIDSPIIEDADEVHDAVMALAHLHHRICQQRKALSVWRIIISRSRSLFRFKSAKNASIIRTTLRIWRRTMKRLKLICQYRIHSLFRARERHFHEWKGLLKQHMTYRQLSRRRCLLWRFRYWRRRLISVQIWKRNLFFRWRQVCQRSVDLNKFRDQSRVKLYLTIIRRWRFIHHIRRNLLLSSYRQMTSLYASLCRMYALSKEYRDDRIRVIMERIWKKWTSTMRISKKALWIREWHRIVHNRREFHAVLRLDLQAKLDARLTSTMAFAVWKKARQWRKNTLTIQQGRRYQLVFLAFQAMKSLWNAIRTCKKRQTSSCFRVWKWHYLIRLLVSNWAKLALHEAMVCWQNYTKMMESTMKRTETLKRALAHWYTLPLVYAQDRHQTKIRFDRVQKELLLRRRQDRYACIFNDLRQYNQVFHRWRQSQEQARILRICKEGIIIKRRVLTTWWKKYIDHGIQRNISRLQEN
uniref:Sfi1 spindle body domain-containing protein n=1 Tax=Spongospora subterranea TaxID=70186 RepID=A0A0H5RCA2_9EUKA|eukprot:CRZ11668.1 hypothetical protein [Spongospora subterranea]